jgi:HAD superfamily hydrolase (TIGR01662 family)
LTDHGERWVVLDVGETIIDESRIWTTWADELGIPRTTFMSVFGSIVERGLNYQQLADYFPVVDWVRHRDAVESAIGGFRAQDLYPDAVPALSALREQGYRTAIIANQPARRDRELRALGVHAEVMAMSDQMGVSKPDPAFFTEALTRLGDPDSATVAYVGDRIDNDVLPAAAAGMRAVWLRRGPWGVIPRQAPPQAHLVVGSLAELARRIDEVWR